MEKFRFRIHRFKRIDSTNTAAFRYARHGAPSGSVFVAEYQTHGRGKWGRRWVSPRGKDLLFSILLRPQFKAPRAPWLTQLGCRSVAKILARKFGLHPRFRRPNDVMVNGKKICGVLVEAKGRPNGDLESLVMGIGLNVNANPRQLVSGATSLAEVTGREQSRTALLRAVLNQIRTDLTHADLC